MKFSEAWLRAWVNPPVDTHTLAHQFTMAGLEVDGVHPAAGAFTDVVVGQVLKAEQHPDADRLRVCEVDVGQSAPLTIVCGGVNVRAGLKVAVAVVGAVLPGDFKIKAAKLRGVPSAGMICSAEELELTDLPQISHGILELPDDAPVGVLLREYMALDDQVIAIDLTPNRGDCLSIQGLAREIGVINGMSVNPPEQEVVPVTSDATREIQLATKGCPRYVGRVVQGIDPKAQTPLWLQEKLRRSGIRPIHPVVDVCNYVMLELGQPMHGFDLSRLKGAICVRESVEGETLTLLDERTLTLVPGTMIIADAAEPLALAGIMGGKSSGVSDTTVDVFLEAAFFNPVDICLNARRYHVSSDSSYRFERGVDFTLPAQAMARATALLLSIAGGQAGPLIEAEQVAHLPPPRKLRLMQASITRLLGIELSDDQVEQILTNLGMQVVAGKGYWDIEVPSFRFDIEQPVDLIEELARIYGYEQIPGAPMVARLEMPQCSESALTESRLADCLTDMGYFEAITYSFIPEGLQALIDPAHTAIPLVNPIAADMAVMRTSLWPGLIQSLLHNQNRQCERVRLFEMGLCFWASDTAWMQVPHFAMLLSGPVFPKQWGQSERQVDFYDLKGDVERVLQWTGEQGGFEWRRAEHAALHPGQSAALYKNNQCIGYLGTLHPKIAQQLSLNEVPYLFEVTLEALLHARVPKFERISKFPAVRRDLALVMDTRIEGETLLKTITQHAGKLLNTVQIFDIYQGAGIAEGKKSVALGLTFQDPSRTLRDEEINDVIQGIVSAVSQELQATLRA